MKSFQVTRAHLSPYQHPDFMLRESALLESLPGIEYRPMDNLHGEKEIILITNTHTRLKELSPALLKRTRMILHPNSGYDHFAEDHSLWKNIPTIIGHKIRAQAVAEYSLGCLFEGLLEIPQHIAWSKDRKWDRKLMQGLPVCVFGFGHIGKSVASTLKQLGMSVVMVDPFVEGCASSWKGFNLGKMQVVISCMSLNSTSRKLFNQDFFNNAHPELLFINGARGGLVDEKALREFLLTHPKAFAFLDVFEKEPFTDEWLGFPQVWKTSHISGVHQNLDQGILDFEFEVLNDYLNIPETDFSIKYQRELLQNKWIKGELI
ncbi:MAG TPA: NAD(P)-dependent oxidoreductase [Bacteriovoracaceae bacterium]|nr:NAD(P)-dependent oxidoreductase [Bacteriovoracaceae bacterium]